MITPILFVMIALSIVFDFLSGMIGAVGIGAGLNAIELQGLEKILIALFISPIIGLILGYFFTRVVFFLARDATPKINIFFKRSQIVSAIALSLSHGRSANNNSCYRSSCSRNLLADRDVFIGQKTASLMRFTVLK